MTPAPAAAGWAGRASITAASVSTGDTIRNHLTRPGYRVCVARRVLHMTPSALIALRCQCLTSWR